VFTPEQSKRIEDAITAKGILHCPMCRQRAWVYGDRLILLEAGPQPARPFNVAEVYRARGLPARGLAALVPPAAPPIVYPMLTLLCEHCGNTVLLEAALLLLQGRRRAARGRR